MVSRRAMASAKLSSTATSMARSMLLAVFDSATLLQSNLKGGSSKRPGGVEERFQKLDEEKLEGIFCKLIHMVLAV